MKNNVENGSGRGIVKTIGRWIGGAAGTVSGTAELVRHPPPESQPREPRNQDVHFEHTDVDVKRTFITALSVLIGIWVVSGLMYLLFVLLAHERAVSSPPPLPAEAHGNPLPPEPRLQPSPRKDLKAFRAREDWELSHYFWVDKGKGTVAIPIERAMDILAARGIPPQKQPPGLVLSQPQAGTRATGFEGKVAPEPR